MFNSRSIRRLAVMMLAGVISFVFADSASAGNPITLRPRVKRSARQRFTSFRVVTGHRNNDVNVPGGWTATPVGNSGRVWEVSGGEVGPGGSLGITVQNPSGTTRARIVGGDYKKNGRVRYVGVCADPLGYAALHGGDQGYNYLGYWIPPDHWGYFYQMYNPADLPDTVQTLQTIIKIDTAAMPFNFQVINKTFEIKPVAGFDLGDLVVPITLPDTGSQDYDVQHYMEEEDATDTPGVDTNWVYDPTTGEAIMDFPNGLKAGETGWICAYTSQLGPAYTSVENVSSTFGLVGGMMALADASDTDPVYGCPNDYGSVCMAPTTAGPLIGGLGFGQLDWYSAYDGSLLIKDSSWGRLDLAYQPDTAATWYLSVSATRIDVPWPSVWVVQNLPLFPCTRDCTSMHHEAVHFNLLELQMFPEEDINQLLFDYNISYLALDQYPFPGVIPAPVDDRIRRAGDSPDEPPEPSAPFFDPGVPEGVGGPGPATKKNADRDVRGVQEGDSKCCAGSFARSLDWLNREYDLGVEKTAQEIYEDLIDSGVSEPNADGTPARDEWIDRKNRYANEQTGDRIITKVWDADDYVDTITGVGEQSGDFLEWLKREIETEDVEVAYYYPGNAHIVTVTDVYTKDGCVYVKYRDDETQGDTTTGDSAVKHAKVYEKDGKYHFGTDANTIYFGVSESVTPPDIVIRKIEEGRYRLSWDEPGNYRVEAAYTPGFEEIIATASVDASITGVDWIEEPGERQAFHRLVRVIPTP